MISEKNHKFNPQQLKIPGKTFLAGEYAVLAGGSCLSLATNPCFMISPVSDGILFHPESPAGLYLKKNSLENFAHHFFNPYGTGGFGASTAEFIFSYFSNPLASPHLSDIFTTYLELFSDRKEQQPSGADLVTQLIGGLSHINLANQSPEVERLSWNFNDLEFLVFSTGLKVNTHEHLSSLDRRVCETLVLPSQDMVTAFKSQDSQVFRSSLSEWSNKLEQLGLTAKPVIQLKQYLEQQVSNILVKPCGALGADVIVILCSQTNKAHVLEQIKLLNITGLQFQADSQQLINGPLSI